ncbi:hypothetical protein F5Y02DRAFT_400762 [Annulohypoxylon stygium]|nr:hypothetical protein F5Y02DRAFT_400762 [Annulohypoxylon stygium]
MRTARPLSLSPAMLPLAVAVLPPVKTLTTSRDRPMSPRWPALDIALLMSYLSVDSTQLYEATSTDSSSVYVKYNRFET